MDAVRRAVVSFLLLALVGCSPGTRSGSEEPPSWDAPHARWVSDLKRFEKRNTYNEYSSVGDGGRWVVFNSHVRDRPDRIFMIDSKRGNVRQLDDSHDGAPRVAEGVRRWDLTDATPEITVDGRYVAFSSGFSNLVRHDDNAAVDVFVYDRITRKLKIASRSSDGRQVKLGSFMPAISANGED
jgi:hypothetical protein